MPSSVPMYSPTSNEVTSRSEDSTTAKQTSKSSGSVSSQKSIPELYEERAHNLRVFELKELRNATNDFSRLLKIGEGGFGSVYKGFVKPPDRKGDGTIVAIKKLNPQGLQVKSPRDLPSIYNKDYAFVKLFNRSKSLHVEASWYEANLLMFISPSLETGKSSS